MLIEVWGDGNVQSLLHGVQWNWLIFYKNAKVMEKLHFIKKHNPAVFEHSMTEIFGNNSIKHILTMITLKIRTGRVVEKSTSAPTLMNWMLSWEQDGLLPYHY